MARLSHDYRRLLASRLRNSSDEIKDAVLDRIYALEAPASPSEKWQIRGLQKVIGPLFDCGLEVIESGERSIFHPPPEAIAHARKLAWTSVSTRALQERYLAGYTVFASFLRRANDALQIRGPSHFTEIHRSVDISFERLISTVADEHEREHENRRGSSESHRLERINGLLAGRLTEAPELSYPFDATHVGVVGIGAELVASIRKISQSTGADLLLVRTTPHQVWAWIGGDERLSSLRFDPLLRASDELGARVAVGDPAIGLKGWRLTHQQAITALVVAAHHRSGFAQYSRVALLASAMNDELLIHSLSQHYLLPLSSDKDGGTTLFNTLRAYFSAEGNVSSAAVRLGVTRHTVTNRLRTAENLVGQPLRVCGPELELALRLKAIFDGACIETRESLRAHTDPVPGPT